MIRKYEKFIDMWNKINIVHFRSSDQSEGEISTV